MKILFLSFYFPPDLCAGSFRAKSLIEALKKQDKISEIDILTTIPNRYKSFKKKSSEIESDDIINIRRIELPKHKSGMLDQSRAFLKFFLNVLKYIRGKDYDMVYATSSRLMTAFLGAYVSNKIRKPLYLDIRDIFTDTMSDILSTKFSFLINPILNYIEKITFRKAVHINLVSAGFFQHFKQKYPRKNYSFYTNGIDDLFLKNFDKEIPVKNNKVVILYAGNIGEGQGLNDFLPTFAHNTKDKYHFRIIGDGGKRKSLEEEDKDIDIARFARFAFFGFILQAPWNHFYYLLLDGALPPTEDPFTATTGIKVVIDQFVQAPIFTVLIFYFLGILEGKSTDDVKDQLDRDYKGKWQKF